MTHQCRKVQVSHVSVAMTMNCWKAMDSMMQEHELQMEEEEVQEERTQQEEEEDEWVAMDVHLCVASSS